MAKLTVAKLRGAKHPGDPIKRPIRLSDDAGLCLQIAAGGSKSWLFRFTRHGNAREMGLGPADPDGRAGVSLSKARELAADARRQVRAGLDPILERNKAAEERLKAEQRAKEHTFRLAAEGYIAAQRPGWKNKKHAKQWESTLETYVYPSLGGKDVADIVPQDVLAVLTPIWETIPETASRVRQRIETILDYSSAPSRRWRSTENPARWRGVLEHELPAISAVRRIKHFPSLPWQQVDGFMKALDDHSGVAALALKFAILTACRSGEARGATWNEIDLENAIWTIPARRMKRDLKHRVPLSKPALKVLSQVRSLSSGTLGDFVFPSPVSGMALSDMGLSELLRGMSYDGLDANQLPRWRDGENRAVVVHGFRTTFKSWARSHNYLDHLSELALSHIDQNKARSAYARDDLLEERRPIMEAWGRQCTRPSPAVSKIRGSGRH